MAKLNNSLKFIIFHVNFLFSLLGLAMIGFGIYMMVADWGQLDKGFFMGSGAVLLLCGFIATMASMLGNFGVTNQKKTYGVWTGRRILFVYQAVILALLIAVIYCIFYGLIALSTLRSTKTLLEQEEIPPFTSLETYISNRFNLFFFGAAYKTCGDAKYSFFWPWINSNCQAAINQATCQKCADYSPVSCVADSVVCPTTGEGNTDPTNVACPYTYCRQGVLDLLVGNITTISYGGLGLMGFTIVVAITACMLVCYTERDTIDKQVFKSGTLANTQFVAISNSGPSRTSKKTKQQEV